MSKSSSRRHTRRPFIPGVSENPCPRNGETVIINSLGMTTSKHIVIAEYKDSEPTGKLTCLTCGLVYGPKN